MAPTTAWWQHPEAYLYAWNPANDTARFLTVNRRILQRSPFLDPRIATDPAAAREVAAAQVLAEPIQGATDAPTFIFHTAFCCSTLLARSLDLPDRTLALREPATLLQLADRKRWPAPGQRSHTELLDPTIDLLSRPFSAGERILIKPTNLVNNLAPEILRRRPRSRALILHDGVDAFLISVLKRPRQSREGIEQFLSRLLADRPQARPAAATAVDLPRKAALAWALQMQQLEEWLAGQDGARIRTLTAGDLLDSPVQSLCAVAEWLGIELSPSEARAIGAGPVWRRDAKAADRDYTPERRRQEQALARRVLTQPIAEARGWLEGTAALATGGFPQRLSVLA